MKRIYLDSNILIAHFATDKSEEAKTKLVENALAVFSQLKDAQLCTSMWAVTEMVNILVSRKKMNRGEVAEIESQLVSERRLKNLKISFLEVSPERIMTSQSSSIMSGRVSCGIIRALGTSFTASS